MLEITLETMAVDADGPNAEQLEEGVPPFLIVHVVGGSSLPLADPGNPRMPLRFPSTTVHFPLTKQGALDMATMLQDRAALLPDAPISSGKLVTASSIAEAEQVAKVQGRLTKK